MTEILFEKESYELIGLCMEVHRQLGPGFNEAIYREALEIELTNHNIPFEREKRFLVDYKGHTLRKSFNADLVVYNSIILEAKAVSAIIDKFIGVTMNYLRASRLKLGIIANFGEKSFQSKRVVFGDYQITE